METENHRSVPGLTDQDCCRKSELVPERGRYPDIDSVEPTFVHPPPSAYSNPLPEIMEVRVIDEVQGNE